MCSRPSRTDEPYEGEGYNQNPNPLAADLTTNQDLNGIANSRENRNRDARTIGSSSQALEDEVGMTSDRPPVIDIGGGDEKSTNAAPSIGRLGVGRDLDGKVTATELISTPSGENSPPGGGSPHRESSRFARLKQVLFTYSQFIGPGFMIAVAYIDPGNYATDIAAGATYRFKLLFIVLLSNLFAILLQSLAIKLGTVTGLDLSSACRAFLPRWLNYVMYALAEIAIIATDIAEVIGTAIALNLLIPQIPLIAGCALSILDVMVILFFYNPSGSMRGLRLFELFVCLLVLGVVICFCIQLSMITDTSVGEVFRGYLPSSAIVEQQGLYQACGILGATVMPHSLFLGSGIVQPRLREYDTQRGLLPTEPGSAASSTTDGIDKVHYIPSQAAIKHSLKYSIIELALSLFTFALFVNSAILIVAGASLYNNPDALGAEDIFAIHALLSRSISPAAGTIFALALLLSGISAGIVCTIAGQMVSEGALNWKMKPWLRRLITRLISITPSIIIAAAVGRSGLNNALTASQVALSSVLPFVTAPLIYFTCLNRYMTVQPGMARFHVEAEDEETALWARRRGGPFISVRGAQGGVKMANSWWLAIISGLVWLIIAVMNVANLVLLGLGQG
ncbi:natural resistance-associated macrophage protein-domain-containing protein [Lasiosphaeria hispida]|uniref:Natural resistance-associated macrophage protein-domain-containing protein n=1 Tax=Lasiosphaeria hispida TaxID=260671 RepID=A0AAJ0HNM0_9PEZI|nr:natural resistance-associated macrophage protein-domain-containing protein [Lasiosphaeria hispida]